MMISFWPASGLEQPTFGSRINRTCVSIGASLDRRSGKLIESKAKVLYEQMPVIYIYAINTTAGKDPKLYECPVYRKPQRTDLKYVGSIDFETDMSPRHWTLRGVALLCDIK
jgi:dynein heavy chain, axonemal